MSQTVIKTPSELLSSENLPSLLPWDFRMVLSEECLSYVAWNSETQEAILVDPKREDKEAYFSVLKEKLSNPRVVAVIDTHTHADHISLASDMAEKLNAPLVMSALAPSQKVHLRVSKDTVIHTQAGDLKLFLTPGHTQDSVSVVWGPFIFGGDTFLYGDTGRDDLPTGSAEAHYESVQKIKKVAQPNQILLPGHDHKGGRASSWRKQLEVSSSLTQSREDFVKEASAFNGNPPKFLKESLKENFK